MEAAPEDQGVVQWGCLGTPIPGADGIAVDTGAPNTVDILLGCTTTGIAADLADDYMLDGFDDWFLPSKDELILMWENLADSDSDGYNGDPDDPNNPGGFANVGTGVRQRAIPTSRGASTFTMAACTSAIRATRK